MRSRSGGCFAEDDAAERNIYCCSAFDSCFAVFVDLASEVNAEFWALDVVGTDVKAEAFTEWKVYAGGDCFEVSSFE